VSPARADWTRELVEGRRLLLACAIGLGAGVHALAFYSVGVFIKPLEAEFGWSRTQLSVAPSLLILLLALATPLLGMIADKRGERPLIRFGLLALGVAFLALAASGNLLLFYGLHAAMAVLAAGSAAPTYMRIVNRSFVQARGTALAIAMLGTSAVSMATPVLLGALVLSNGWRAGYLALAGVAFLCIPVILTLLPKASTEPHPLARAAGAGVGEVLGSATFWRLAFAFLLISLSTAGLVVHLVPLLIDRGGDPLVAASTAGLIGGSMLVARMAVGVTLDRVRPEPVCAAIFVLSALLLAALAADIPASGVLGAVGIGIAFGCEGEVIAFLAGRYFRGSLFGPAYSLLYAVFLVGSAASPVLYGLFVDRTGAYEMAIWSASVGLVIAALALAAGYVRGADAMAENPPTRNGSSSA